MYLTPGTMMFFINIGHYDDGHQRISLHIFHFSVILFYYLVVPKHYLRELFLLFVLAYHILPLWKNSLEFLFSSLNNNFDDHFAGRFDDTFDDDFGVNITHF